MAKECQRERGVPASVQIAQWVQETGFGESVLSARHNNDFGIKCFRKKCRGAASGGHCVVYADDVPDDRFRKYKTKRQSWEHHARLVTSGRYAELSVHGKNWERWCLGLQRLGYATDKRYAEKLIGHIKRYGLNRFDE